MSQEYCTICSVFHDEPPQPQPPLQSETNSVEKFDVSEVYPQEDVSDIFVRRCCSTWT